MKGKQLSDLLEEAEIISGAVGPAGAVAGGVAGAAGYVGGLLGGGTFKTSGFLASVGTGALAGAISGPAGIAAALHNAVVGFDSE